MPFQKISWIVLQQTLIFICSTLSTQDALLKNTKLSYQNMLFYVHKKWKHENEAF